MSRFGLIMPKLRGAAAAALITLGSGTAVAQQPAPGPLPELSDYVMPSHVAPAAGFGRHKPQPRVVTDCPPIPCTPCPVPGMPIPGPSGEPGVVMPPVVEMPDPGTVMPDPGTVSAPPPAYDFSAAGGFADGAGVGPSVGLSGYIENAAPVTMFRLRGDFGYGNNRPDRAEFFYPKCGCFSTLPRDNPAFDPRANGPLKPETSVDYQELSPYFEFAVSKRFSVFATVPVRWINPEQNANAAGISDVSFGVKYAVIYNERRVVSLTTRTITPTGDGRLGLGTTNWWVEPGVLWLEQVSPRWQVFGEVRDQIPVAPQSDYAGNVLRYGLGTSYVVCDGRWGYVAPVVESVGWTVLSGKETAPGDMPVDAAGATIVNLKLGVRIGLGKTDLGQPYPSRSDLYIGYGRALTGEVWYRDLLRVEFRRFF